MNILIKLTSLVGLTIAPLIGLKEHNMPALPEATAVVEQAVEFKNSLGESLGAAVNITLPSGVSFDIPEKGVENKLFNFLSNSAMTVNDTTWFDFDRLTFKTNSAELDSTSAEQLQNIANMMAAYPTSEFKIGGYTDNSGDKNANLKLSSDRANFVMNALIEKGIAKERLKAEGYGDAHPVCPANDTDECKSRNRRISLKVSKK
jgi:K(+)-stimulated pyrophosphate-energized sodium pump